MKFSPTLRDNQRIAKQWTKCLRTYGATPATVGVMPRYKAKKPPSVLYIIFSVAHIPGSLFLETSPRLAKEADCMDRRVRTMSSGYVNVTEVMPAAPPQISRLIGESSAPGEGSTN